MFHSGFPRSCPRHSGLDLGGLALPAKSCRREQHSALGHSRHQGLPLSLVEVRSDDPFRRASSFCSEGTHRSWSTVKLGCGRSHDRDTTLRERFAASGSCGKKRGADWRVGLQSSSLRDAAKPQAFRGGGWQAPPATAATGALSHHGYRSSKGAGYGGWALRRARGGAAGHKVTISSRALPCRRPQRRLGQSQGSAAARGSAALAVCRRARGGKAAASTEHATSPLGVERGPIRPKSLRLSLGRSRSGLGGSLCGPIACSLGHGVRLRGSCHADGPRRLYWAGASLHQPAVSGWRSGGHTFPSRDGIWQGGRSVSRSLTCTRDLFEAGRRRAAVERGSIARACSQHHPRRKA